MPDTWAGLKLETGLENWTGLDWTGLGWAGVGWDSVVLRYVVLCAECGMCVRYWGGDGPSLFFFFFSFFLLDRKSVV